MYTHVHTNMHIVHTHACVHTHIHTPWDQMQDLFVHPADPRPQHLPKLCSVEISSVKGRVLLESQEEVDCHHLILEAPRTAKLKWKRQKGDCQGQRGRAQNFVTTIDRYSCLI